MDGPVSKLCHLLLAFLNLLALLAGDRPPPTVCPLDPLTNHAINPTTNGSPKALLDNTEQVAHPASDANSQDKRVEEGHGHEKDEYMRSPCDISEKYIVIELCETIQPHTIELGNYELFSSGPKAIRVSAAEKFPANEWSTVLEESVFIKLNKRIAALELNMSLSSEYLSELSRQYVAQSEAQEKNIVRAKRIADEAVINATTHINKTLNVQLETMRREVDELAKFLKTVRQESAHLQLRLAYRGYKEEAEDHCDSEEADDDDVMLHGQYYDIGSRDGVWTTEQVVYVVVGVQVLTVFIVAAIQWCFRSQAAPKVQLTLDDVNRIVELKMQELQVEALRKTPPPASNSSTTAGSGPTTSAKRRRRRKRKEHGETDSAVDSSLPTASMTHSDMDERDNDLTAMLPELEAAALDNAHCLESVGKWCGCKGRSPRRRLELQKGDVDSAMTARRMDDTPRRALIRIGMFAAVMLMFGRSWWFTVFCLFIGYRVWITDFFQRVRATISRDAKGLKLLISVKREIKRRLANNEPIHKIFLEKTALFRWPNIPEKTAVIEIETGKSLNFDELNRHCNQYANYFETKGYNNGDVISLFLENSIDFFAVWLGLSKIGVVSAFINSNLKLEPLAHSIRVAEGKSVITSTNLLPMLKAAIAQKLLPEDTKILLVDGDGSEYPSLARATREKSVSTNEPPNKGVTFTNILCYIYTSGTTGNPKPAVIKHFRYFWIAMGAQRAFGIVPDDKVYITMPLYHSAAGIMGIGSVIVAGTTAVIRKKFSASNFWKDCVKYDCTASQYIGEICRYLLAQPESAEEKKQKSTSTTTSARAGSFPIYPHIGQLYPVRLIKVDEETGELVRGPDGLCVPCSPGDTGEMIGVIKSNDPLLKFEGYVNKGDTAKKIYRDVLRKGDQVFASGDILYWDLLGYLYFRDRRGDTFRWKGENVSTTEVEGILQPVMEVEDATVYGVEVGKMEGRAGMAGVVLVPGVDHEKFLQDIAQRLTSNLASYAVPVFIRFLKEVDKTGTFKLKKLELQKQGYDLAKSGGDSIYYWSAADKGYCLLTAQLQSDIDHGIYAKF
ncbi:unnamed protein product, partial [Mesorhabditis spiculigera]